MEDRTASCLGIQLKGRTKNEVENLYDSYTRRKETAILKGKQFSHLEPHLFSIFKIFDLEKSDCIRNALNHMY